MGRLIISKQLEQAAGQYYSVQSDINGDLQFILAATLVTDNETTSVVTTDGDGTGVTHSGTNDHTVDIVLLSGVAGNVLSTGGDGGVYLGQLQAQDVVADIVARDALTGMLQGDLVFVTDASADGTVSSGWAVYTYAAAAWVKTAEQEGLDETAYTWIASDGVTTQTVNSGETFLFSQGDGILADVVATDQLDIGLRIVLEEFSVNAAAGSTVTIAGTLPTSEELMTVYRNGLIVPDTEWSLAAQVITFTVAFGGSTSGTDAETVEVKYFEG